MKKYKFIKTQDYEDQVYEISEKCNLNDEEKKEVNILISRYTSFLQKINETLESDKLATIKKEILQKLKETDV